MLFINVYSIESFASINWNIVIYSVVMLVVIFIVAGLINLGLGIGGTASALQVINKLKEVLLRAYKEKEMEFNYKFDERLSAGFHTIFLK